MSVALDLGLFHRDYIFQSVICEWKLGGLFNTLIFNNFVHRRTVFNCWDFFQRGSKSL